MDRISYAGATIHTGTKIAHALLDYAQALAQVEYSAAVQIPAVAEDGTPIIVEVLVGPASQLLTATVVSGVAEIEDADLVAWMGEEAARLRREGPPAPLLDAEQPAPASGWDEYAD